MVDKLADDSVSLVLRMLSYNGMQRDLDISLHTKTTLTQKSMLFIFKDKLQGQRDLKNLHKYAENNNFSILFYPNSVKENWKNWLFFDIDKVCKDKLKVIVATLESFEVDGKNLLMFCNFVNSGTGLHIYVELDFSSTEKQFSDFQKIVSRKMKLNGIEIDSMTQSHRMRLCGSINEKYNKRSNVFIYSEKILSEAYFVQIINNNKIYLEEEELKYSVDTQDTQTSNNFSNDLSIIPKQVTKKYAIDTRFAYFNAKTGKIATRRSCGELINYFYKKNNGGRWNTIYQLFGFLYVIGVLQNKRDLYRYLGKVKAYSRELFSEKDSSFYENDEYFAILTKCKWVNELKEGDFTNVKFENSEYEKFFTGE